MYKECEKAMGKKKIRVSLSERILQIVIYIVVTIFVIPVSYTHLDVYKRQTQLCRGDLYAKLCSNQKQQQG